MNELRPLRYLEDYFSMHVFFVEQYIIALFITLKDKDCSIMIEPAKRYDIYIHSSL